MKTLDKKMPCKFKCIKKKTQIGIRFKENIKVTKGYYLYSALSLIAEIGGCIGLGRTIVWAYGKAAVIFEKF